MEIEFSVSRQRLYNFLDFMKMSPNINNSTLKEVQGQKFVKLHEKSTLNFTKVHF